jgi:TetR/AcrR family transcriptional regulator, transcriptional repressor for nem operon
MTTPKRRVGRESSAARKAMLNSVEQLMMEDGYASVTYRAIAARAGVTAGLVQYYFPSLDDLFAAAIRRRAEQNVARLHEALAARPEQPLRVLWEFSRDEAATTLVMEYMALANHRKAIRRVIAEALSSVRDVQLSALEAYAKKRGVDPAVLTFVVNGVPKMIGLEASVGVTATHANVVAAWERYLDQVEPANLP